MTKIESSSESAQLSTAELPVLAPRETRQLIEEWNSTTVTYPHAHCLHRLFEAQVERTPDAVALICEDQRLSYRELNARANQLAHYLRRLGVGPEAIVPICVERSIEMVVGLYGILKAGAAYLPLDPAYPVERLVFMLEDCRSPVLLTQQDLRETLPQHEARAIYLDADWKQIETEPQDNPAIHLSPDNLAYVIYTSGSTGRPKGAMNTHGAICNRILWMQDAYRLDATDCVLQKTPFSFDVSVWEFFWPLLTGARLVMARPLGHHDNAYLADVIAAERVTTLHFVPPMLQVFLEEPELRERCASLRRVICSGEALPYDLQRRFFSHLDAELHNLYGPTEAAVDVTFWQCERDGDLRIVPIGRPIANTEIHLLDEHLEQVPIGEPGELHIGGVQLARGYLNRLELTAERFIPHPFSRVPGGRLYKTGDLARYLADGAIEYMGRIDHQVKMSGVRIELGEIEASVVEHPSVRETVVLAREDTPGNKRLVAYLVADTAAGATPPDNELRAFLFERLPHYMVPSAFIWMESWPLTASGKVDRLRLPAPPRATSDGREFVAPRTPVEELIAGVLCAVMNLRAVSVHDNFFDLGGHSLLAAMLVSRVRRNLQADIYVPDVFEHPTIAELAVEIEARRRNRPQATNAPLIRRTNHDGRRKLSYAQQRLWFLHQLKPESAFYNLPLLARLNGPLDITVLEESLDELARRHEVLRTRLVEIDGEPVQVVEEPSPFKLAVVTLGDGDESAREEEAQRVMREAVQTPFDLTKGPLWRAVVVRLDSERHLLAVVMHHIISDGWSLDVLARELSALYTASIEDRAPSLTELPVQYGDFAVWQREWLAGGAEDEQLRYWRRQLDGSRTVLQLPTDRPRPPVESYRGSTLYMTLEPALAESLRALARRESSTLFMMLLAAFQTLLYRYTGQADINIGTPLAGRNWAETESLIGFFVNTVVIRTRLSGQLSFAELLRQVRETTLAAYAHQEVPFERLVEELQVERSLSHAPLFQVVFAFNNTARPPLELPGVESTSIEMPSTTAKFDLALVVEDAGAELKLAVEYSTDLFDAATIERMTGHFRTILESVAAAPGQRLAEVPLLDDAEAEQLLRGWNDTRREFPRGVCIHELFERQAAATPGALAVSCGDEQLTYAELNARADWLASRLSAQGVGPETLVGICVERSPEMIVGALAILKAGAAYVPLDPRYPRERLAFMLEEANAPVLLTTSRLAGHITPCRSQVLCLDSIFREAGDASVELNPKPAARPDNLAYLIYTSGSTGRPKGVSVTHAALVNLAFWYAENYELGVGVRASQVARQSFDASVWEVWPCLLTGGSLHLPDDETIMAPARLWQWLRSSRITHCFLPTPLAETILPLVEIEAHDSVDGEPLALRYLLTGGDKLHQYPRQRLPFRLVNLYGPTENTVISTACNVESASGDTGAAPPIGRPISNTRVYILDQQLRPVPVGVPGELYVSGAGLARGYLNHPELTAERFLPDPFIQREDLKGQAHMSEATKNSSRLSAQERAALVMELKRKAGNDTAAHEVITRQKEAGPFPLSFAQQRLWFLYVLEPHSPYTIPAKFHLKGPLNAEALECTLNEIVRRHESLRTTFTAIEGQPVQMITPHLTLPMPVYDLSQLNEEERERELRRHMQESQRPFDLTRGPLVRACLLRVGPDEHILRLTMHHIISDGWSIGVTVREMAALYDAFNSGRRPQLPELAIQYRDFAVWQRTWLSGAQLEAQLAYWRENLRGAAPALELPTDRPRPPVQTYRGETLGHTIGKRLARDLHELSRREGVTLYMTLLAAFKTLLFRYTGQADIVVGTPIANRNRVEVENLIGFFVNTLVLRTDLSANPTFSALLARVRDTTLGAFAHQDLPFEKLVEELQPERDMSRTPLFQVMFSLQNAPLPSVQLGGVEMRLMDEEIKTAQFDLTFDMMERDETIQFALEYNTDLFSRETAERMLGHYMRLLEAVVADPHQSLLELPLLSDEECRQQLVDWNSTQREFPASSCVHELFEERAANQPGAVALARGDEQLTYAEVNARANQLARYLRRAGAQPEDRIGILLDYSAQAAVALLGILKAGAAYVAFDPLYPPERLRHMIEDAGVSLLLTSAQLGEGLPQHGARVINLDAERERIAEESAENPGRAALPDNLAYLVYTSGTTGRPKGILVQHRSLVNAACAFINHHRVTARDRILQFASLSFDVAAEEFFAAWLSGARLVMRPEAGFTSPEQFVSFLEQEGVTLVNLPASFWAEWATAIAERGCALPSSLRRVVVGNEKTLPESLAKWQNAVGDLVTWNNAYGPSEATITASNYEPPRGAQAQGSGAVPIGRPVMNARMYVLDPAQQLVPVGVAGELCIGGAGVARGYHAQPEQTAERFSPDPHAIVGGERMYRTGDLARYLPDGNIEFLGRVDEQVKVRGFRIELGEIETVLCRHEGVREAVVIARPDEHGGNRLIAYVVERAEGAATGGELRRFLKNTLPEYMIPSAFVTLDALPLTPNGKVDRKRLPELDGARPELEEIFVAPRSELERDIARIWQEVLKVEKVGIHDNFFQLGGHSLLIVQVNSRLREVLRVEVSIIEMFKYPTVSALAEHLSREEQPSSTAPPTKNSARTRLDAMDRQRQLRQKQLQRRQPKGASNE